MGWLATAIRQVSFLDVPFLFLSSEDSIHVRGAKAGAVSAGSGEDDFGQGWVIEAPGTASFAPR
jgi:hypothetical protein